MKLILLLLLAIASAFAQSGPTPAADPTLDPTLPQITVGVGPSWTRGDVHAASADVDIAVKLGGSNAYSWSTISTPVAKVPAGSPPLASTITTGAAYVVARSTDGRVSLLVIGQGGLNSIPATGANSFAVTGSAGLPIRIKKKGGLYFMPYAKASKPTRGTDGALVSTVLQFGGMLIYGFGGK